jgi:hypothetical protein
MAAVPSHVAALVIGVALGVLIASPPQSEQQQVRGLLTQSSAQEHEHPIHFRGGPGGNALCAAVLAPSIARATHDNHAQQRERPFDYDHDLYKYSTAQFELVIARYNEDIGWAEHFPFTDMTKSVYVKHGTAATAQATFSRLHKATYVALENVGREGHTFLTHIIDRWDSLADHTVFSQGSLHRQGEGMPAQLTLLFKPTSDGPSLEYNGYRGMANLYPVHDWRQLTEQQIHRMWGPQFDLRDFVVGNFPLTFSYPSGAYMVVSRERIRKHSRRLYEELREASKADRYVGYGIEKLWPLLFDTDTVFKYDEPLWHVHCKHNDTRLR